MFRHAVISLACLTACAATDDPEVASVDQDVTLAFHREHVSGDIWHYELVVPVGHSANAAIKLHRMVRETAPFVPRHTPTAVMMLHGDFSTFDTSFAPGLAPYLAAQNIDVWGVDRRWTLTPTAGDVSDFGTMGLAQELDDIRVALVLARAQRLASRDTGRMTLVGFSHGAQLAYTYASVDAARAPAARTISALVPLDFYGGFAPDQADLQQATCDASVSEYQLVADGTTDSPNGFFIDVANFARTAPDDPSPYWDSTNRGLFLLALGQTYVFAPFAPFYHLLSPILDGDVATGLRQTSETAANAWLAHATPHESMLEAADLDAQLCGTGPIDAPLSRIRVPLYYVGAAGGVGSLGVYATTQVSSTDVTATVWALFGPERRAEDIGHADLLFGHDAPAQVWNPLARWLARH